MSEGTASPCEAFNTWFSVDFASSAELCKRVYEVRYGVSSPFFSLVSAALNSGT